MPDVPHSSAEISEALDKVVILIHRFGDSLLPIFLRLEDELEHAKRREAALDRVKAHGKRLSEPKTASEPNQPPSHRSDD